MTQNGNPPINFEPHEWAIIILLKHVRDIFIKRKVEKWKDIFSETDPVLSEILKKNLVSAFLNTKQILHYDSANKEYFESYDKETIERDLEDLLDKKSFLLFNSYYYSVSKAFGETSLIPIVPGYNQGNKDYINVINYFSNNKLPFRIDPANITSYASLILPCTGGITPYYFDLVTNYKKYRGAYRGNNTFRVPYFLGDLRILFKLEDFLLGNLSALVTIIGNELSSGIEEKEYVGAYVLTSIIPDAFDEEDEMELQGIINDLWSLRILSIKQKPTIFKGGIRVEPFSNKFISNIKDTEFLLNDVENGLKNTFEDTRDTFLGFKVQFGSKKEKQGSQYEDTEKLSAIALKIDNVYRIIRSIFPSGPWLDRGLVCDNSQKPYYPIKINKSERDQGTLNNLCRYLYNLFWNKESIESLIKEFPPFKKIFCLLLPELSKYSDSLVFPEWLKKCFVQVEFENNKNYSLLIIQLSNDIEGKEPKSKEEGNKENALNELITTLEKELFKSRLPEGENRTLIEAQSEWISQQNIGRNIQNSDNIDKTRESKGILEAVNNFYHQNTNARAILVVRKRDTYVPTKFINSNEKFQVAYLTYPCFWLFEKLNHIYYDRTEDILNINSLKSYGTDRILTERYIHMGDLDNVTLKGDEAGQFDKSKKYYPDVTVTIPKTYENRQDIIASLNFLGLPIKKWEDSEDILTIEIIDKANLSKDPDKSTFKEELLLTNDVIGTNKITNKINELIIHAYRFFIRVFLRNVFRNQTFSDIFPFAEAPDIEFIDIQSVQQQTLQEDNNKKLLHQIKLRNTQKKELVSIEWSIEDAVQLEFCCIKDERIMNALKNPENSNFWEEGEVKVECPIKIENKNMMTPCSCAINKIDIELGAQKGTSEMISSQYICDIARKIITIEENALAAENAGKASLVPAMSHATGTELASIYADIDQIVKLTGGEKSDSSYLLEGMHSSLLSILSGKSRKDIYKSATKSRIEIIEDLEDYITTGKIDSNLIKNVIESYKKGFLYAINRYAPLLNSIKNQISELTKKNRAFLKIDEAESKIQYKTAGKFSLESDLVCGILIAMNNFYANITGSEVNEVYKVAAKYYWGEENLGNIKRRWEEEVIYELLRVSIEKYDINFLNTLLFLDEHNKSMIYPIRLTLPLSSDIKNIRHDSEPAHCLAIIFFTECILNALKYSSKTTTDVIEIIIDLKEKAGKLGYLMIKNSISHQRLNEVTTIRGESDEKGKQLTSKILRNIFSLTETDKKSFHRIEGEYFIVEGDLT